MKYLCILTIIFLLSHQTNCTNPPSSPHHLKKQRRAMSKEAWFLFDGEKYDPQDVDFNSYYGNCFIKYNSTVFDFSALSANGEDAFSTKTTTGSTIDFSICKDVIAKCDTTGSTTRGLIVSGKNATKCNRYASNWNYDKMNRLLFCASVNALNYLAPILYIFQMEFCFVTISRCVEQKRRID